MTAHSSNSDNLPASQGAECAQCYWWQELRGERGHRWGMCGRTNAHLQATFAGPHSEACEQFEAAGAPDDGR